MNTGGGGTISVAAGINDLSANLFAYALLG